MRVRAKGVWSPWLQLRSLGQHGILSALGCVPRREEIRFGVAVSGVHGKSDFLPWRHLSGFETSGFKTRGYHQVFCLVTSVMPVFFSAVKPTPTFFASRHMPFFPT